MDTACQTEAKKPRKYCIVSRSTQAKIVEEARDLSQRDLAKKYKIPRTSLQHWIDRKAALNGKMDPVVVNFYESPSGQAWLHKLVVATCVHFHLNGNSGIPELNEFFERVDINKFVGTSESALEKVCERLGQQTAVFVREEVENLAKPMPHKHIPGALDENFIMDGMTLILMEPISGYILAEQLEEKRDAETWHKVTQSALKGLNVTLHQLVGDEASGLKKLAAHSLNIVKGSDLFHVQQEITKGLTSHLARTVQQVKKQQEDLQKEKLEVLSKFGDQLKRAGGAEDLSKRGVNAGKRLLEIEREEKVNHKKIEITEKQYKKAQEARRTITHTYHPFNLDTGEKQTPEVVKAKIETSYAKLETVAKEADCTDKQKKKLEKSKGSLPSMIAVLMFFFSFLTVQIKFMGLDELHGKLFEKLVSIKYLKLCLQRTKKKIRKEAIKATLRRLEEDLKNNPLWRAIDCSMQAEWWRRALECAQIFQRSSSCVEGRNGQLSLKFHAFRHLTARTLTVLTGLHNFFIRRADGTTAAERFFGQKHRDLFTWLLDKVELPRPRKNHKRRAKNGMEKQAA